MALFDAFSTLDDIKGGSGDANHKGEIDIASFSWRLYQTGVSATGGGGGAEKVKVHDISFVKKTTASSPLLKLNCAISAHIPTATFVVRKAGGEQLDYLKIKLTDVLLSSSKSRAGDFIWFERPDTGGDIAGTHKAGGNPTAAGKEFLGFRFDPVFTAKISDGPRNEGPPEGAVPDDQLPADTSALTSLKSSTLTSRKSPTAKPRAARLSPAGT